MNPDPVHAIVQGDKDCLWHPFTPHSVWFRDDFEPVVIVSGEGSWLTDARGRRYLDGNSSIWTNLHGHRHPLINQAITEQLNQIAHSSFLGLTHPLAVRLARRLLDFARPPGAALQHPLTRVFYSDDGSTAIEAALKIATQFFQQNGAPERTRFLSLGSGYHGDTVGAMSVGQSPQFHTSYRHLLFSSDSVPPPACYRCPFNRAKPERGTDARLTRKCSWECIHPVEEAARRLGPNLAGFVVEPIVQGAAGFLMHPDGYLSRAAQIIRDTGGLLILDEVMTGFYRTGTALAYHRENVQPDLVALAKGLTGGYLPMAATLLTETLFRGFDGGPDRTFYHGHSYCGNQLGASAALANLELLTQPDFPQRIESLRQALHEVGQTFWALESVGDVRQEGTILAIELVKDFSSRTPFPPSQRLGAAICQRAAAYGLLTRPVGNVLLLMPPYSTTPAEVRRMGEALFRATQEILATA